jgi:hypothetical protein
VFFVVKKIFSSAPKGNHNLGGCCIFYLSVKIIIDIFEFMFYYKF